ncbi:MAG: hypothetical protein QOF06_1460 [Solirubrobacterales bacterium]|nr:hypothetical protein [Solirubrobacterales bacterium]
MARKWIYVVVVGVLAAIGAGCGGGSDESTSTTTLSKAEFTKTVNAICKKTQEDRFDEIGVYDEELVANGEKPESPPNLEKKFDDVLLPSMKKQQEELENVGVPKASQAKYEQLMEDLNTGIERLEEEKVDGLRKAADLLAFQKEAAALGLNCGA